MGLEYNGKIVKACDCGYNGNVGTKSVYYSYSMYSMLRGLRAIISILAYDILLLMVLVGNINL